MVRGEVEGEREERVAVAPRGTNAVFSSREIHWGLHTNR